MLAFCGYNFFSDENCLDFAPTSINDITNAKIQNGIFDHFNATKDVASNYSTAVPIEWGFDTILNADFNGSINAGNVGFLIDQVDAIRVKRRVKGTFDWITLKSVPINKVEDLSFVFNDNLNKNYTTYEYAFVPMLNNVEGNYIVNEVDSSFDGIFVCDQSEIHKFYSGTSYGNTERVQAIATFETLGSQYPIYVSNGKIDYHRGSFIGSVLGENYLETRTVDRVDVVKQTELINSFLVNRKGKILKDWNQNFWLILVVGNPSIAYDSNFGMGTNDISFSWTEIGNGSKQDDLIKTGVVPNYGG